MSKTRKLVENTVPPGMGADDTVKERLKAEFERKRTSYPAIGISDPRLKASVVVVIVPEGEVEKSPEEVQVGDVVELPDADSPSEYQRFWVMGDKVAAKMQQYRDEGPDVTRYR